MSLPLQHFPEQPPNTKKWFFPKVETSSSKQAKPTEDPIMRRSGQKFTSEVQHQFWSLLKVPLHMFTPTLVLLCRTHDQEEERLENQPNPDNTSATGALVTWNSCVRLLCPAAYFPSRNQACKATYCTKQPIPALLWLPCISHCVCPLELQADSLPAPSWAPPFSSHTREETVRAREGRADGSRVCLPSVFPLSLPYLSIVLFLSNSIPCIIIWTLVPVLPNHSLPPKTCESKKKGRNVSSWQVSRQLCQQACWEL